MATKPIPVRIPEDWLPRLDAAAKKLGTNRARLISFCAQTFAEAFAKRGVAMMPPNWEELLDGLDGRRDRTNYLSDKKRPLYSQRESGPVIFNEKANSKTASVARALAAKAEEKSDREHRKSK